MRLSARHLLLVALLLALFGATACTGRARRPAIVVGGAFALGGTALAVSAAGDTCHHSDSALDTSALCGTFKGTGIALGSILAVLGSALVVGSILADEHPTPHRPTPPAPPATPAPVMDPEPAAW